MKLSTKIILPIIIISALLILLNGCISTVPDDESPGFTPGTITGIIASPCCSTSADAVSNPPSDWCCPTNTEISCQTDFFLQKNIEVILSYGEDEVATTTTNEKGEYTFTDVPAAKNYVITVFCPDKDRLLVKDVASELVEGNIFDAQITDWVSTSLGLVVDYLVDNTTVLGPENIELDEVIADKCAFIHFPAFLRLVIEVRRVGEDCGDLYEDDAVQDALCKAAEEVGRIVIPDLDLACVAGYTPSDDPEPCDGNLLPVIDSVKSDGQPVLENSTVNLVLGESYEFVVTAHDQDNKLGTLTYYVTVGGEKFPETTNNQITVKPTLPGTFEVYLYVNDGCESVSWGPVTVEVHDECYNNEGPFLTMPDNDTVDPGSGPYTWSVTGSDPDGILGTPLEYSLVSVSPTPTNSFTVDPTSGEISWDPDCNDIDSREDTVYTVTVEVYDGCDTAQDSFDVTLTSELCECFGNEGPFLTMPDNDTVDPGSGPYTWNVTGSDPDGILGTPLEYSLVSVSPTPTNSFTVDPTSGEISWDPDCEDVKDRVDTVYTVTVEVDDGCDTDEGSFDVTLVKCCISTDLSGFSLEVKEGSTWIEYLGGFDPDDTEYDVLTENFASHFRFTVDAECPDDAVLEYNWYRGAQCGDSWLTGESGYTEPPSTWISITSGGIYPADVSDQPVCNKGGNVLFVKVTNDTVYKIYKVYVDRP